MCEQARGCLGSSQPRESDQGALNATPPHSRWRRFVERCSAAPSSRSRRHAGAVTRSSDAVSSALRRSVLRAPLVRLSPYYRPIPALRLLPSLLSSLRVRVRPALSVSLLASGVATDQGRGSDAPLALTLFATDDVSSPSSRDQFCTGDPPSPRKTLAEITARELG
jgi:hypothetical protein